ncbi:hypothetical protein NK362_24240, partial [Salmonella enterica]|uniref:hypothetical protein n=1 Tax=Salmonella enterica TaxID=28901 RepID=UPI0022B5F405
KVDARVCASSRLCSTYRAMHEAERRLAALESRLLDDASAAYASYRASDPDHLVDLVRAFLLRCRRICCGTKKRRVKTRPTAEAEDGGSRPALRLKRKT